MSLAIILMAGGHSPLIITGIAAGLISYITLVKQNGKNQKTEIAFGATGIVILLLLAAIFLLLWDARSGGLNEIQAIQEDVMYYYNTNLHINMLQITVCMVLLSTLGAVLDTALSITSSLYEVILEDVMYYYNTNLHINMLQITVCMVLLSTLGAVLDTALSITSSLYEVILHKPDMSRREIYHSGLQIGKDIIGTTVNTLFFAYLGDSLLLFFYLKNVAYLGDSLLLFFYLKNVKYTAEVILNSKMLFQGVSAMLFSAIACLLTVPVASAGCMLFLKKEEKKEEK